VVYVSQCGLVKWDRKLIVVWGLGRDCVVQVSVCLFGGVIKLDLKHIVYDARNHELEIRIT
jgi:hypothetical protein